MTRRCSRKSRGDPLATSFLDVLSNGLGAGILLMVLIAAIPIERPAAGVPDAPFIRASWTVSGDAGAVLYLRLKPPGQARALLVDTRSLSGDAVLDLVCKWPGVTPAGSAEIYGFTVGGSAAATRAQDTGASDRSFVLWVSEPTPGPWEIGVVYANRSDSGLNASKPVHVIPRIETRSGIVPTDEVDLPIGGVRVDEFDIGNYSYDTNDDARPPCTAWF